MDSAANTFIGRVIIEKYPPTTKKMLKWIEEQKFKSVKLLKYEEAAKFRDLENHIAGRHGKYFTERAQEEYFKLRQQENNE